jgi:hypothetical protein
MTDPKKPGVAFWATAVVVVLLAYPLSQGPAGWIVDRMGAPPWAIESFMAIYWPVMTVQAWLVANGPKWIEETISWYLSLWQ